MVWFVGFQVKFSGPTGPSAIGALDNVHGIDTLARSFPPFPPSKEEEEEEELATSLCVTFATFRGVTTKRFIFTAASDAFPWEQVLVKSGKLCCSLEEKRGGLRALEEENMMDVVVDECVPLLCGYFSHQSEGEPRIFFRRDFYIFKEIERNSTTC